MKKRLLFLPVLALVALAIPRAQAQAQPLLSVNMTEIDVNGVPSFGYNPPPFGPNGAGTGNPASPVNGGYGTYTDMVTMWALATGTSPAGGFTYTFFVNGQQIGSAEDAPGTANDLYAQGVSWTPSQPGVYYFSAQASDGLGHTATSLAVEYFAIGISIVSPVPNTIVPVGSSVVIQASAAVNAGAVASVAFYADSVLLGTSNNYPYSIIYTPPGPSGTVHFISARSYLANGTEFAHTSAQGIQMVAPVLPLPVCTIGSPAQTTPPTTIPIPNYQADSSAYIPITVNAGAGGGGTITQVQLYINGVLFGTDTALPYNFNWAPTVGGTYYLTALAYDAKNNIIASTTSTTSTLTPAPTTVIVGSLPSVAITSPSNGATLNAGSITSMTATATDTNVDISGNPVGMGTVQFFQDGNSVGTAPGIAGVSVYTISFKPTQKINSTTGLAEDSVLTAIATDDLGFQGVSPSVDVAVTSGGGGGGTIVGIPPTVSLTAPSSSANVTVNTNVTLTATATAPNGNVASVSFLVDSSVIATASQYPYSVVWTPKNLGTYTITAQVSDNLGDKVNSSSMSVNVVAPPVPTVSVTSPAPGGIITVGTAVSITANAASSTGTISQVQFFENGILIGTETSPPYTISFTPLSTGIYTLTAIATDYAGQVTTSTAVAVEAAPQNNSASTVAYFGQYQGLYDGGLFGLIVVDGVSGTFIGLNQQGVTTSPAFLPDISINSSGVLSSTTNGITGTATTTGVNGTLSGGETYIGAPAGPGSAPSGYFTGSITGQAGSDFIAIAGTDGQIMVYASNGSYTDTGYGVAGTVNASGQFTLTTAKGNRLTGTIDPSTYLVSATLSGTSGGSILGGRASGGTFSDGTLRNLSTRGIVNSGNNAMIAGFVVNGTVSKQLLVRAVGPTLASLGVQGTVAATVLTVNSGSSVVASNTGWDSTTANATAVAAAETQVGAFALNAGSGDSALVGTFAPGAYTATVSGANGDTGIGLVEVWDLDTYSPFMTNKLINVSTRANVGTGQNVLIGGFVINGSAPKKVLIRGPGPTLGSLGVTGNLTTPHLQLYNSSNQVIRENFSWGDGNDPGLVSLASSASGAFAYTSNSADSAILIVLSPGTYTVELSSASTSTGVGLVEIYEVP